MNRGASVRCRPSVIAVIAKYVSIGDRRRTPSNAAPFKSGPTPLPMTKRTPAPGLSGDGTESALAIPPLTRPLLEAQLDQIRIEGGQRPLERAAELFDHLGAGFGGGGPGRLIGEPIGQIRG